MLTSVTTKYRIVSKNPPARHLAGQLLKFCGGF